MNILFLTHRLPYAPNRGDRIRAYHLLQQMSRFAEVSLFSLVHDDEEALRTTGVKGAARVATARVGRARGLMRCTTGLASRNPLTHLLLDAPDAQAKLTELVEASKPDLVLAYCSGMARFALAPPLDHLPLVLDLVDVDSEKWKDLSRTTRAPRRWIFAREARTLAQFEIAVAERARAVLVVSEREEKALHALTPRANVHVVRNGVDVEGFRSPNPPATAPIVVFSGVLSYEPNMDAVCWFLANVWPMVLAKRPDARFRIVGSGPSRALELLAEQTPSVELTGAVDAVQPHLWQSAVSVAPLRTARGVQNKVLEALAAGLPTVITSPVRAGLPGDIERGCRTADEPEEFANIVLSFLNESGEVRRARAARSGIDTFSWARQLAELRPILERAAGSSPERSYSPAAAAVSGRGAVDAVSAGG